MYDYGLQAGDRIGIFGDGGLGHPAIQFAAKMGMEPVVFSSTEDKKEDAFKLGAVEFHITQGPKLGGVKPVDALLITTSVLPDLSL